MGSTGFLLTSTASSEADCLPNTHEMENGLNREAGRRLNRGPWELTWGRWLRQYPPLTDRKGTKENTDLLLVHCLPRSSRWGSEWKEADLQMHLQVFTYISIYSVTLKSLNLCREPFFFFFKALSSGSFENVCSNNTIINDKMSKITAKMLETKARTILSQPSQCSVSSVMALGEIVFREGLPQHTSSHQWLSIASACV